MNDLNFPVLNNLSRNRKRLSMDAYLKFVLFNLHHAIPPRVRRVLSEQRKRKISFARFRIK